MLTIKNKLDEVDQKTRQFVAEPQADKEYILNGNPFQYIEELKAFDKSVQDDGKIFKSLVSMLLFSSVQNIY